MTMTDTLLPKSPAAKSELPGCDQSSNGILHSYSKPKPQHLDGPIDQCRANPRLEQPLRVLTSEGGMARAKKRGSETLDTDPIAESISLSNVASAAATFADIELSTSASAPPAKKTPPSKRKRRVSFCKTTKPPSDSDLKPQCPLNNLNQLFIMKHAASCTSLPDLATGSSGLLVSENPTGELDLSVSPAAFVQTIVLQSKSITGAIRGEDIISNASERVKNESYFLTYTHEHLEAYTADKVSAVSSNDVETLRSLLKSGHLMQASNRFGESMLHTSCRRGYTDMVEFFVNEARVTVRVRDDMGRTPMHDACWSSAAPNHDIMKMLICAAPELLLSKDKRGHSPFDYARREYWPNWVSFLNEHRQFIVNSLVSSCLESSEHLKGVGTNTDGIGSVGGSVANQ